MNSNFNSSGGGINPWEKFSHVTGGVVAGAGAMALRYKSKSHKLAIEEHGTTCLFKHHAVRPAVASFNKAHLSDSRINGYLQDFWNSSAGQAWQENQTEFEPGTISYQSKKSLFGPRIGGLVGKERVSLRRPNSNKKSIENSPESPKTKNVSFSFHANSSKNFVNPVFQKSFVNSSLSEPEVIKGASPSPQTWFRCEALNSISMPFQCTNGSIQSHRLYEISTNQLLEKSHPEKTVFLELFSENNFQYFLESDIGVFCSSITLTLVSLLVWLQVYKFILRFFIKTWKEPDQILKIVLAYNKKEISYEQAFIILCTQFNQTRWEAIDLLEPAYDIDILELPDQIDSNTQMMLESYIENDQRQRTSQPDFSENNLYSSSKKTNVSRRSLVSKEYLSKKLKRESDKKSMTFLKPVITFFLTVYSCIYFFVIGLFQCIYYSFLNLFSFISRTFKRINQIFPR